MRGSPCCICRRRLIPMSRVRIRRPMFKRRGPAWRIALFPDVRREYYKTRNPHNGNISRASINLSLRSHRRSPLRPTSLLFGLSRVRNPSAPIIRIVPPLTHGVASYYIERPDYLIKKPIGGWVWEFAPIGRLLHFETSSRSMPDYVRSRPLYPTRRYVGEIQTRPSLKRRGRLPIIHIVAQCRETPERAPLELAICSNFSAGSVAPSVTYIFWRNDRVYVFLLCTGARIRPASLRLWTTD